MEFKEFENPEQKDYDIKVGVNNIESNSSVIDNSLNTDEGIDLNILGENEIPIMNVDNPNVTINEFGEIIREGKSR